MALPNNSYFGIGFGTQMTNTPMILFETAEGNGRAVSAFAKGHDTPEVDAKNKVNSTFSSNGSFVYISSRLTLTQKGENAFSIPLVKDSSLFNY